jgi:UPF0042 nucleotide-binding protein
MISNIDNLSLVVVTGMSGAGKTQASNVLEDLGYYTMDNMPLQMIDRFMSIFFDLGVDASKIALVIDVRSGDNGSAFKTISKLKTSYGAKVIFMTADEEVLIRRYKESRRAHPLKGDITEAIARESALMSDIKDISDLVVDTSTLNVHELVSELNHFFEADNSLLVTVSSFGFKFGIPTDSDLLFDVRFMQNPHFVPELKEKTGREGEVQAYVMADPAAVEFMGKLRDMLAFLMPHYRKEGKRFLVLSIGCTGGKHRSVTVAELIAGHIAGMDGVSVQLRHRDIGK